jgi:hypothetical protein
MAKAVGSIAKDDTVLEALECFKAAQSNENDNRTAALDDIKFARLGEQWPQQILNQRNQERRPALTINKLPAFIRQVTNEARQNKPAIKVRPVDSGADRQTAEVYNGLIRNIEQSSAADIAYDTASDAAVTGGFGYIKVDFDYAHDDTFDKEIKICPVYDPFSIYADPNSTSADSSDWMKAFEICPYSCEQFELEYPKAAKVSFDADTPVSEDDEEIILAKYWVREEVEKTILMLSDGTVVGEEEFVAKNEGLSMADIAKATGLTIKQTRKTRSYKVTRKVLSGAEALDDEKWPGIYIPIIPVYGDVVNVEGKRHFQSLIRHAKDAQRQHNYWHTSATEMLALAPKAPFLVAKGSTDDDPNWQTANTMNHAVLEYTGQIPPIRLPADQGAAAASINQALLANDNMKGIIGIYDASLGQRSNETSGKAIMARQREGDVSTYHFIDNLSRAIRHTGRIVMDLIPKVYTPGRIVRTIGSDGDVSTAQLGEQHDPSQGVYNLGAGKYDLTVEAGPSYTTKRVEASEQMIAMMQANPDLAPVIGDLFFKMQDWPFADKIEERLKASQNKPDPEQQKLQMEQQKLQMQAQHDQAKSQSDMAVKQQEMALEREKAAQEMQIEREKAALQMDIERMKAGVQMELQSQKTQGDIENQRNKAAFDADLKAKGMEQKQQAAVQMNLGDGVAGSIGDALKEVLGPLPKAIAEGVVAGLSNVTLKTQPMRRIPIRDKQGNILETRDEPIH